MSIASKLEKLQTDLANAYNSIETKGGTIPQNKNTENLSTAIEGISGGGGGDGSSLNIFVQDTEPEVKKGIWLQTNKTPEHYIYDEEVFIAGEWTPEAQLPAQPKYGNNNQTNTAFSGRLGTIVGTDIYYLENIYSSELWLMKYDTINGTYTNLVRDTSLAGGYNADALINVDGTVYSVGSNDYNYGSHFRKYNATNNTLVEIVLPSYTHLYRCRICGARN